MMHACGLHVGGSYSASFLTYNEWDIHHAEIYAYDAYDFWYG